MIHIPIQNTFAIGDPQAPFTDITIADAGVYETNLAGYLGKLYVIDATNSVASLLSVSPTKTTIINADAKHTVTKANATTLNIYFETDNVKIQNLTGAEIVLKVYAEGVKL